MYNFFHYQYIYLKYRKNKQWDFLHSYKDENIEHFLSSFYRFNTAEAEKHTLDILEYLPKINDLNNKPIFNQIIYSYFLGGHNFSLDLMKKSFPVMDIQDYILLSYCAEYFSMGQSDKIIKKMNDFKLQLKTYFLDSFCFDFDSPDEKISQAIAEQLNENIFFIYDNPDIDDFKAYEDYWINISDDDLHEFNRFCLNDRNKILNYAFVLFIKNHFAPFVMDRSANYYSQQYYSSLFIKPYHALIMLKEKFNEYDLSKPVFHEKNAEMLISEHLHFMVTQRPFAFVSNKFPDMVKTISDNNSLLKLLTELDNPHISLERYINMTKTIIERKLLKGQVVCSPPVKQLHRI